jgi:pimeloyl-ACP methyl ester carboxylesterase
MIPYDDFGGRGPVFHFSHPNAYTPGSFRRFLAPLAEQYRVIGARHRPLWYLSPGAPPVPGPEFFHDWNLIADDLLRFLDQQRLEGIIGAGHSLGAVATMKAALREPERFRALVLIEPVFLPPGVLDAARANPQAAAEQPFVLAARRRRDRWPDRQAAFERFREKSVFANFPDETLWDYVNESLHEDPATGEVVLSFPRDWEAAFYAHPPLDVWDDIPRLSLPTLAVRGDESDTLFPNAWALWQTLQPAAAFVVMSGVGHMLTLEAPEDTAEVVLHWLKDLEVDSIQ